jgi:hypothetical protein
VLCCAVLCFGVQGMAESRELEDFDGCKFSYCLISRCDTRISSCAWLLLNAILSLKAYRLPECAVLSSLC